MTSMNTASRMKQYERQYTSMRLLDCAPVIARMDGKRFTRFSADLERPFDSRLSDLMVETTKYLVDQTNARCGYTQSDEISLLWHESFDTMIFFNYKLLKMASVLASMTSAYFNKRLPEFLPQKTKCMPLFDARVFNVPDRSEVIKYFAWREHDATTNSLTSLAHTVYSHTQLYRKKSSEQHDMLMNKGINWNDYPDAFKRGTYIRRRKISRPFTITELDRLPEQHHARKNPNLVIERSDIAGDTIPPLSKIHNAEEVIFNGQEPETCSSIARSS